MIGATAVKGAKNFLVLLRGDRLGELGVLDAKSLAENKALKMPWCTEGGDGEKTESSAEGGGDDKDEKEEKEEKKDSKGGTRGAKSSADPEEGGE